MSSVEPVRPPAAPVGTGAMAFESCACVGAPIPRPIVIQVQRFCPDYTYLDFKIIFASKKSQGKEKKKKIQNNNNNN